MKNFSSLIKENNETNTYKYNATVVVEGTVIAMNDGDAGELVDKTIDSIPGVVDFTMNSLDIQEKTETTSENILLGDERSPDEKVEFAFNTIIKTFTDNVADMTDYHKAMLATQLKMYFNSIA